MIDKTKLVVLIDSREHRKHLFAGMFRSLGIQSEIRYLKTGDYSFNYDGKDYADKFIIERKSGRMGEAGGWNELRGNIIGKDRTRFVKEFRRAEHIDNFILLIENAGTEDWKSIKTRNGMKLDVGGFKRAYDTFMTYRQFERKAAGKPPIRVVFCHRADFPKTVVDLITEYLKKELK